MKQKVIETTSAPKPVGPYSQAIFSEPYLFCSGQVAIDPNTNEVLKGTISEQAKQVLDNIGAVLKEAGLNFSNVVKSTIFLTDMNDFAQVNEVYSKYFKAPYPARSTIAVSALPKGVNVEIEVIAMKG